MLKGLKLPSISTKDIVGTGLPKVPAEISMPSVAIPPIPGVPIPNMPSIPSISMGITPLFPKPETLVTPDNPPTPTETMKALKSCLPAFSIPSFSMGGIVASVKGLIGGVKKKILTVFAALPPELKWPPELPSNIKFPSELNFDLDLSKLLPGMPAIPPDMNVNKCEEKPSFPEFYEMSGNALGNVLPSFPAFPDPDIDLDTVSNDVDNALDFEIPEPPGTGADKIELAIL